MERNAKKCGYFSHPSTSFWCPGYHQIWKQKRRIETFEISCQNLSAKNSYIRTCSRISWLSIDRSDQILQRGRARSPLYPKA